MAAGNQPGNGKTNPFGNGQGGAGGQGAMANNFVQNPKGNNSGSKPRDFVDASRPQQAAGPRTNPQDAAAGPSTAAEAASPPPTRQGGTGTVGNGNKPFRLGGG